MYQNFIKRTAAGMKWNKISVLVNKMKCEEFILRLLCSKPKDGIQNI